MSSNHSISRAFVQAALIFGFIAFTLAARAESFSCTSVDQELVIELSDASTSASRVLSAGSMRLADAASSDQNRLIADFNMQDGRLRSQGNALIGQIDAMDPRIANSNKRIGNAPISDVRTVALNVDLSFADRTASGLTYSANAVYALSNGDMLQEDFDCLRQP